MSTLARDLESSEQSVNAASADEAPQVGRRRRLLGDRGLRRLAALLAIIAVLEALAVIALGARGDPDFPLLRNFNLVTTGFLGTIVSFPVVGALIIGRRPRTRVAWVMIGIGTGMGTAILTAGYGAIFVGPAGANQAPLAFELLLFSQILFVPTFGLGTTTLMLLYPTDTLLSARWRIVLVLAVLGSVLWDLGAVFRPGQLDHNTLVIPNPLGAPADLQPLFELLVAASSLLTIVGLVAAGASLLVRYRHGDSVVRAQLRWFGLIAAVVVIAFTLAAVAQPNSEVFFGLAVSAVACLPIAIGVAITRYRLYDIDLIINRALVYGSLTAILAGVFTAGVGLGQRLFVAFTGASSDAAIVLATLVIATLYAPLRKRLEAVIDKRFKYETRRFGSYADKVKSVLAVISPPRAAESLAREAVSELGAVGAAVLDERGAVVASAGAWPLASDARTTTISIADSGPIRAIVVGPERNGRDHAASDLAALEEVGRLTAEAVGLS